jgi:glutathione synthase
MEINVFSPGGLGSAQALYEVNFAPSIIGELERKVNIRRHYPEIDNTSLATS